ncbi:hypothetical protein [Caulobacter soli]|uniref:hypothetical protein n=1 Tax=Caulobacter soli TaxID=2708539 RepID=UPI0013EB955E|nr:hypothetical protein [Caulobacter soli]
MRRTTTALAGILVLGLTTAAAKPSGHSGVYDNIRSFEETGDIVGARVEVFDGPKPYAVVRICEGECPEPAKVPATITGDTIAFTYILPSNPPATLHVTGRFTRRGLMLRTGLDEGEQLLRPGKPYE